LETTFSKDSLKDTKRQDFVYDLVGILVHQGTSDSGHYYSFIKDRSKVEFFFFLEKKINIIINKIFN